MSFDSPILIVDDEPEIRESLADLLRTKGIATLCASSAAEAMYLLKTRSESQSATSVRLIICDWMMPEVSGVDFLYQLSEGSYAQIPFLLMSGAVSPQNLMGVAELGADAVLLKPFTLDTLMQTIQVAEDRKAKKNLG